MRTQVQQLHLREFSRHLFYFRSKCWKSISSPSLIFKTICGPIERTSHMQNLITASELDEELSALTLDKRIALIAKRFAKSVFTTSLGLEDQVLTWAIAGNGRSIDIVTL